MENDIQTQIDTSAKTEEPKERDVPHVDDKTMSVDEPEDVSRSEIKDEIGSPAPDVPKIDKKKRKKSKKIQKDKSMKNNWCVFRPHILISTFSSRFSQVLQKWICSLLRLFSTENLRGKPNYGPG
jgi:hypothetical protein